MALFANLPLKCFPKSEAGSSSGRQAQARVLVLEAAGTWGPPEASPPQDVSGEDAGSHSSSRSAWVFSINLCIPCW